MVLSLTEGDTVYQSRRSALVPAEIRKFAMEKGIKVGVRGRFSKDLISTYLASDPAKLEKLLDAAGVERPKSLRKASESRRKALAAQVAGSLR